MRKKLTVRRVIGQNKPRDPFGDALRDVVAGRPVRDSAKGPQPLNTDGVALFPWCWMYDVEDGDRWIARVVVGLPGAPLKLDVVAGALDAAEHAAVTRALEARR